jgi:hypothetical protein
MITLNYLLRVSFVFTSKISEDRHVNFHYKRECWFTQAKTGLYSSHEPDNKGVPLFCVSRISDPFIFIQLRI